ncbi:MAG: rRNA pseudouridine synthase [Lachnospiraceae bacterium]|nr:rRNA pseudouridine synthase [Lachnospiraceae bacterium]
MMRLDRFLANNGFGTRQEVKKLIRAGRIMVDGVCTKNPEVKLDEEQAVVLVDGNPVFYEKFHYIMLNKPAGCVSSSHEPGEKSVLSYIGESYAKDLFPVGRLDKDTEGLLLLTNDGALSHRLLSPSKHVDKRYYVELEREISKEDIVRFREGIDIGDEKLTLPAVLERTEDGRKVFVTLHEGRFHQIKRMFLALNNQVIYLKRVSMKNLTLDPELKPGDYRRLTAEEIADLQKD